MEAMSAPTHMLPGEAPEDVVARLVAYVEQEQRQINQHPVYGMPPNHYQPDAPEAVASPGHQVPLQFADPSYSMMERVLHGLRTLDTEDDPIASRRPSEVTMVNSVSGVPAGDTDYDTYGRHALVRPYAPPYVEPETTPFRAVEPARVLVGAGAHPQQRRQQYVEPAAQPAWPTQDVDELPRRVVGRISQAEITDEIPEPRWLRDADLDRKFAKFLEAWEESDAEEERRGRHRRETRFERISKRIGLSLGVIAASSAIIYAGMEWLSQK